MTLEGERPRRSCRDRASRTPGADDSDDDLGFLMDDDSEDESSRRTRKRIRRGGRKSGETGLPKVERTQRSCRQGRRVSYKEADESDEDMVVVVEPAASDDVEMQQDGEGAEGHGDDEQPPAQEEGEEGGAAEDEGGVRRSSRSRQPTRKVAENLKSKNKRKGGFDMHSWLASSGDKDDEEEEVEVVSAGRAKERAGQRGGGRRRVVIRRRREEDEEEEDGGGDSEEDWEEDDDNSEDDRRSRRRSKGKARSTGRKSQESEGSRRSQRSAAATKVTYNVEAMFKESVEYEKEMARIYDEEDERKAAERRQRRRAEKLEAQQAEGEGGEEETAAMDVDGDSEDEVVEEGDEMPLPRLLARRVLTASEWRKVCDNMNTSEITRGSFWIQEDADYLSESPELVEKFLVRWQGFSYLHVSWESEADLTRCVGAPAKGAIKRWRQKEALGQLDLYNLYDPDNYFDPAFLEVDRVLAIEEVLPEEEEGKDAAASSNAEAEEEAVDETEAMVEGGEEDAGPDSAQVVVQATTVDEPVTVEEGGAVEVEQPASDAMAVEAASSAAEGGSAAGDDASKPSAEGQQADEPASAAGEAQQDAPAEMAEEEEEDMPADDQPKSPRDAPKQLRYLIKWCGLPYAECTWEKAQDLQDKDLDMHVQLYLQRQVVPAVYSQQPIRDVEAAEEGKKEEKKSAMGTEAEEASSEGVTPEPSSEEGAEGEKVSEEEAGPSAMEEEKKEAAVMEQPAFKGGGQLRDYQWEAVLWLLHNWRLRKGSILADEMGLGKTVQTVAFLNTLYTRHQVAGPFLIVAPLSTLQHWYREVCTWTDLNPIVYHGSADDRRVMWEHEFWFPATGKQGRGGRKQGRSSRTKFQVLITTPEMCIASDSRVLSDIKWEFLVVDEAHRLKNRQSRLAVSLREDFKYGGTLLLTGTPLQNTTEELWTLLNFANPRAFSSLDSFQSKYGDLKNQEQLASLQKVLQPYLLRRMKEEVEKGLPPKEETIIEVEMTALQKQYYRALYERNVGFLNKGRRGADAPSLMNLHMELRKCCNHPFLNRGVEQDIRRHNLETGKTYASEADKLVDCSGKLILLDKLLPKLQKGGHRLLIFSQFKIMLDLLEDYLTSRGFRFGRVDGGITGAKRQAAIDDFNRPDSPLFVMLLSTRAGGVGINLTTADTVVIFDSDWNPQNDVQAQARCHRIGQTRDVKIYRLITSKTYEMQMFHTASLKLGLDQAVLHGFEQQVSSSSSTANGAGGNGPPRLSKDELEGLLRHGAYDVFKEEREGASEEASRRFCEEDIDQILSRATKITHGGAQEGGEKQSVLGSFSKASFAIRNETISIDDPGFWNKVVGCKATDTLPTERAARRGAKRVDLAEEQMGPDIDSSSEGSAAEDDSDDSTAVRAFPYAALNRLFTAMCRHGYGQWTAISEEARLKPKLRPQMVPLCQHLMAELVRLAGQQQARDLKAPKPAGSKRSAAAATEGEGEGEAAADRQQQPEVVVSKEEREVQCRGLVQAYAVVRQAMQDLHATIRGKGREDGHEAGSDDEKEEGDEEAAKEKEQETDKPEEEAAEGPTKEGKSKGLDVQDVEGVTAWLLEVSMPQIVRPEHLVKLMPRNAAERLRALDDMLMLDRMIEGLAAGGESRYGRFLRQLLDPSRPVVKVPADWWDVPAAKTFIRAVRSIGLLRLGKKEFKALQDMFPDNYSGLSWPPPTKVSKYLRELCDGFRRLDRGESLSSHRSMPSAQPTRSQPYFHQVGGASSQSKAASSSSSGTSQRPASSSSSSTPAAAASSGSTQAPTSSTFFSASTASRMTSLLRAVPGASRPTATAPAAAGKDGQSSGAAKPSVTAPKATATAVPAPPAAPAATTAATSSNAPQESKAAGESAPASDDDTMLVVIDDDDDEEEVEVQKEKGGSEAAKEAASSPGTKRTAEALGGGEGGEAAGAPDAAPAPKKPALEANTNNKASSSTAAAGEAPAQPLPAKASPSPTASSSDAGKAPSAPASQAAKQSSQPSSSSTSQQPKSTAAAAPAKAKQSSITKWFTKK